MEENKKYSIMTVDDEQGLRQAMSYDLKRNGLQVFEGSSGSEAIEVIEKSKIDVILSDLRMPNGDGITFLNKMKGLNPNLPVFMLISGLTDVLGEEGYAFGTDVISTQTFNRKQLFSTIVQTRSIVDLQINFQQGYFKSIYGLSILRWDRIMLENDLPQGFGIESLIVSKEFLEKIYNISNL